MKIKNPNNILNQITERILRKLSHEIIVHSDAEKTDFMRLLKLNQAKVTVIPHGNYIEYYENKITRKEARRILGIPDSSFVILFFGWLFPHKGLIELIDVFTKLSHKRTMLIIAGKVSDRHHLQLIKKKIKHFDNIKLTHVFVPDDQIQVYMNSCDVVATPYLRFTTSGVVILAMSFGKACIVPCLGSFAELLDNKGAFLYDPDSKDGLAQAIATAIESQEDLMVMGQYNKFQVEKWSWNRVAEMTADLYKRSLSE